jgi:DNA-binding response OmpR family regulator
VVVLDCRDASFRNGFKYTKGEQAVIAIISTPAVLSTEALSEFEDVVFVPHKKEELLARINLALFRINKSTVDNVYELDGFRINFTNYEVMVDGKQLDLTYKEYELLRHLITAPGRVFTRSQLLKNVWGYDYIEGARTVDVHIRRLRSKLGTKYATLIETVRHVGYRFKRV